MILVTGGAGYTGGIVAERLIEQGREVCIYDNLCQVHQDGLSRGPSAVRAERRAECLMNRQGSSTPLC